MLKRILVPLDGSKRAEHVLPLAAQIAHFSGGTVLLLHVMSTMRTYGFAATEPALLGYQVYQESSSKAEAYLAQIAGSPQLAGVETRTFIAAGMVAPTILDTAQKEQVDLIVMSSQGASGIQRWIMGSVAHEIAWKSTTPVLILHAHQQGLLSPSSTTGQSLRALVALDGSAFAEATILPAAELIAACSTPARGQLHLLHLVKTPSIADEQAYENLGLDVDIRQAALYQAGGYLQDIRARLTHEKGMPEVEITWSVEECEHIAQTLLKVAGGEGIGTHIPSQVIALTTHGRHGLERWVKGSESEHIISQSNLPLLMVHPHQHDHRPAALTSESKKVITP